MTGTVSATAVKAVSTKPWASVWPERRSISRLVYLAAAASLIAHFVARNQYGAFRDELYFIACGNHLAFGYIDQPPLVAVSAWLSRVLFGNTLGGFRFFPALAMGCSVLLTGWLTRELGGGRFAQALAALTVSLAPLYLAFGSFLSMNAFEPLLWLGCSCILVRILKGGDNRLWLAFGAVAGIGLQNKHTILMFGFALVLGLLVARDSKHLLNKWFFLGGALALLIFLPNLIWEIQHHWPQIEVVRNCQKLKNMHAGVLSFLGEQALFVNPVASPVVVAGLAWLFFSERGRRFQCLGWAYLVVIAVVIILNGKTYYPTPYYPILCAAGAIPMEMSKRWFRAAYVWAILLSGLAMLPFGAPILPLETLVRYQNALPLQNAVQVEQDSEGEIHQLYADMLGWPDMAATVATVYHRLPPSDQAKCAILAGNYGEAGAIDLFGPEYGLPGAISGHNNYYLWGPRGYTGEVVILFGERAESTKKLFAEVEQAATISARRTAIAENHLPVYVCRRPKAPLEDLWPLLKFIE